MIALDIKEISCSFARRRVLDSVSLEIGAGSLVGLIGPAAAGKSVLLKILAGVIRPESGSIHYSRTEAPHIGLMFQEGALFDSHDVFSNVAFPLVKGRVPTFLLTPRLRVHVEERVSAILAQVGLSKAAAKLPGQLSGGMRKRVALARALVARPEIVLLDDPTSGLDPVASSIIMELIIELHKNYSPTMVIVSHDLRRLLPVVSQVFALFDGAVRFRGQTAKLNESGDKELRRFVMCRYDLN